MNSGKDYAEHLNIIRQQLNNNRAVLFVGAGLSRNAEPKYAQVEYRFKTWTGFIEQLGSRLWPELYSNEKEKWRQKINGNHLMVAQLYQEEYGSEAFYHELKKAIPYKDYEPSQLHKELLGLPWKDIITTNQDQLIEHTLDALHIAHDVILDDLDIPIKTQYHKVYKIHGCMERPASIIFSEEQYRTYELKHPLIYVKMKAIFAEFSVVFVGFSLTDPNFKAIHGWVSDVLGQDFQRKAYAFVMKYEIDPYTKRYWEKRNIILLPVEIPEGLDEKHGYIMAMKVYIDQLKKDKEIEESLISQKQYNDFIKQFPKENLNVPEMIKGLRAFAEQPDAMDNGRALLSDHFWKIKLTIEELPVQERYYLLAAWYPFLQPFTLIKEKRLIDFLIEELKEHPGWDSRVQFYELLLSKANALFILGHFSELEDFVLKVKEEDCNLPINYKNELVYLEIQSSKFRFDLRKVMSLLQSITIDLNDPIWLNRIGNIYLVLGEKIVARDYFRSSLNLAQAKKDDWSQFVSYLSLMYTYSWLEEDQNLDKIHQNLQAIRKKLQDIQEPRFKQLLDYEQMKSDWNDYREWKENLESGLGFNSRKSNVLYQLLELMYFVQTNGIPEHYLLSSNFNLIGDVFLEHGKVLEAVQWMIYFGHTEQLDRHFSFEKISGLNEETQSLFLMSKEIYGHLKLVLDNAIPEKDWKLMSGWLSAVVHLWLRLMPVLQDQEIDEIVKVCENLFIIANKLPPLDTFTSTRSTIIELMGTALFYRQNEEIEKIIFSSLQMSKDDFRILNAFKKIPWHELQGITKISNQVIEAILSQQDYVLLYRLLAYKCITTEQADLIYRSIYEMDNVEAKRLQNQDHNIEQKLLLSRFFIKRLSKEQQRILIKEGLGIFTKHQSTSDLWFYERFSPFLPLMDDEEIEQLKQACLKKIDRAEANKEFPLYHSKEMVSEYLKLLFQLIELEKTDHDKVYQEWVRLKKMWDSALASYLVKWQGTTYQNEITSILKDGSRILDFNRRKDYIYLIGQWLLTLQEIIDQDLALLEILFAELYDSNANIAGESVRALAYILKAGQPWILSYANRIVSATNSYTDRRNISFLTNLAFLYRELAKQIRDDEGLVKQVQEVIDILVKSPYSNVRRELRIEGSSLTNDDKSE